jgi:hypothetical protein
MNGLKIIAGVGAAVILTACASSEGNQGSAAPPSTSSTSGSPAGAGHKPKKGVISGVMATVGGAIGAGSSQPDPHPVPGTVTFTSLRHGTFTTQVDSSGHFSMKLPVGSYHLIGHSPKVTANGAEEPCIRPAAVNVGVDENVQVEVNCIIR